MLNDDKTIFVYVADNQVSEINTCIYGSIIWLPHDVLMDKVHHASDVCWILKPGQLASFTIMFMKSNRSFNKHFWKHFTLSLHPCYFVYTIIIMLRYNYIITLNSSYTEQSKYISGVTTINPEATQKLRRYNSAI